MKKYVFAILLTINSFLLATEDRNNPFVIRKLSDSFGVEIVGLDLSSVDLTEELTEKLQSLLAKHLFIVVRNQTISPQRQSEITRCFGDVEATWNNKNRDREDASTYVITNQILRENAYYKSPTFFWHWDKNFIQYPTAISFAFFPLDPQPQGYGLTEFANLYAAYEDLPENLKMKIENLDAVHSYDHMTNIRQNNYEKVALKFERGYEKFPDVIHPLVRIHPITGKRNLNLDELYQYKIEGLSTEEDTLLRETLLAHATQDKYIYRHCWQKGDFVLWDNLALLHRGTPSDPSVPRILKRTNTSSRLAYEGRCVLIGMGEESPAPETFSDKLFLDPLVIDTDTYDDLSELECHVNHLKMGISVKLEHNAINPHAIVILRGSQWKSSQNICRLLDIAVVSTNEKQSFSRKIPVINYEKFPSILSLGEELQKLCMNKFFRQDVNERLTNCDHTFEYLDRKRKIFVESVHSFSQKREFKTAQLLREVFKDTHLSFPEEVWLEYRGNKTSISSDIAVGEISPPWFVLIEDYDFDDELPDQLKLLEKCIYIDTKFLMDSLFNDIPYEDKTQLWPIVDEEKQQLILLIAEIAIKNGINMIFNSQSIPINCYRELARIVADCGGESIFIGRDIPLETCYKGLIFSDDSREKKSHRMYEKFTFQKVFSARWREFVDGFNVVFLLHPSKNPQILFLSESTGGYSTTSNWDLLRFRKKAFIDPDRLASDIELLEEEEAIEEIEQHLEKTPFNQMESGNRPKVYRCELSSKASDIAKRIQQLLENN